MLAVWMMTAVFVTTQESPREGEGFPTGQKNELTSYPVTEFINSMYDKEWVLIKVENNDSDNGRSTAEIFLDHFSVLAYSDVLAHPDSHMECVCC